MPTLITATDLLRQVLTIRDTWANPLMADGQPVRHPEYHPTRALMLADFGGVAEPEESDEFADLLDQKTHDSAGADPADQSVALHASDILMDPAVDADMEQATQRAGHLLDQVWTPYVSAGSEIIVTDGNYEPDADTTQRGPGQVQRILRRGNRVLRRGGRVLRR